MEIKISPELRKEVQKNCLINHINRTEKAYNTAISALKITKKTRAKKELNSKMKSLKQTHDWLKRKLNELEEVAQ